LNFSRTDAFSISLAVSFLLPLAIPGVGLDYQYFFITVLVLFAWFLIKWESVKSITSTGSRPEVILGVALIAGDYALNLVRDSSVGILDLLVIFVGTITIFYGLRSLRLFWVPATYGIILLLGYQIEAYTPNYTALQDWLAGVMVSAVNGIGISATVSGHIVSMQVPDGTFLQLDVASSCTGLQGILAFGLLSTMALLDLKPKVSRLVPIFAIGFIGAFLINIVRLLVVFLTFEFLGVDAGTTMHVYFGYIVFIVWVLVFWAFAFKFLLPSRAQVIPGLPVSPVVTA
jgi:exosortase